MRSTHQVHPIRGPNPWAFTWCPVIPPPVFQCKRSVKRLRVLEPASSCRETFHPMNWWVVLEPYCWQQTVRNFPSHPWCIQYYGWLETVCQCLKPSSDEWMICYKSVTAVLWMDGWMFLHWRMLTRWIFIRMDEQLHFTLPSMCHKGS